MTTDLSQRQGYHVLTAARPDATAGDLLRAVVAGFSQRPKRLSSRWFYDDIGSELFTRICEQPEYYLTRCEQRILNDHRAAIATNVAGDGAALDVVDLGAGDGQKTRVVLEHMVAAGCSVRYVPIDISEGAMRDLVARTRSVLPTLEVQGLVADYVDGIAHLTRTAAGRRKLVLFLGSTIGNFRADDARDLLTRLRDACADGDLLLIGFDLRKDPRTLFAAYNDAAGAAAAFNLNLLARLNRELGADFVVERFRHFGGYDVRAGTIESFLVSTTAQTVRCSSPSVTFELAPWEPIVVEYSHKFEVAEVDELAHACGLTVAQRWFDPDGWFLDALLRVRR